MAENSEISWTDHTFSPWHGCTKVSHGCTNCYAETLSRRWGRDIWGPKSDRKMMSDTQWKQPIKWNKVAEAEGVRKRVFCASMADVFERHMLTEVNAKMDQERARLWELIERTPSLDWLLLTKRPENIREMTPLVWDVYPRPNVWYGTSTENQEQADRRIPELLKVPAAVRFLSAEPLLGPLDSSPFHIGWSRCPHCEKASDPNPEYPLGSYRLCSECDGVVQIDGHHLHWVITGGESGNGARPMNPDWVRSIRDQCIAAGVAFHHKQNGGRIAKSNGRMLDGREWLEFPAPAVALDVRRL